MQIHEITKIQEGLGSVFKKAGAMLSTPGSLISASGYASAMDKYHRAQADSSITQRQQQRNAQLTQQTQQRARQLAQQWTQQVNSQRPAAGAAAPIPEDSGLPTPAEQNKLQQRITAATAPKTGFKALPGAKPATGNPAQPATQSQRTLMTGTRATQFVNWVNAQLRTTVDGTNQVLSLDDVRLPANGNPTAQALAQLLPAIIQKNDPAAVEQYLMTAMTAIQKRAAEIKKQVANPIRVPQIVQSVNGQYQIGNTRIDSSTPWGNNIAYLISSESENGHPPRITQGAGGTFMLGQYMLDTNDPQERQLIDVIRKLMGL